MVGNTRGLKPITTWVEPDSHMKRRLHRIRETNKRFTASRVLEEALEAYLPIVEQQLGITTPAHEVPTQREAPVEVPG